MACYPESVDTGRQRESSKPVYLVMSVLEDKLLFCLKKKKNLKSYKFYHQTIIQHRWIDLHVQIEGLTAPVPATICTFTLLLHPPLSHPKEEM